MPLLVRNMMCLCQRFRFVVGLYFSEVHTGVLLDCIDHRHTRKRLGQVDFDAAVGNRFGAEDAARDRADQVLGQLHNPIVIGICLIQLQQRKFRVVARIHTFVAEYAAQFVHTLEAADDQPFEVQLERDAEIQIDS